MASSIMSDVFLRSEIKACLSSADILAFFHQRILQASIENSLVKYHLLTIVLVNIKKIPAKSIPHHYFERFSFLRIAKYVISANGSPNWSSIKKWIVREMSPENDRSVLDHN